MLADVVLDMLRSPAHFLAHKTKVDNLHLADMARNNSAFMLDNMRKGKLNPTLISVD